MTAGIELTIESGQVTALAARLGVVAGAAVPAISTAVTTSGKALESLWRSNATVTAGAHGANYPSKIKATSNLGLGSMSVTVAPTVAWSFEYGSVNQPPHLDGAKALDVVGPQFIAAVTAAATGVIKAVG